MISDVLSDAAAEIRQYLKDPAFRGIYDDPDTYALIDQALAAMDEAREVLDGLPEHEELRHGIPQRAPFTAPWRPGEDTFACGTTAQGSIALTREDMNCPGCVVKRALSVVEIMTQRNDD